MERKAAIGEEPVLTKPQPWLRMKFILTGMTIAVFSLHVHGADQVVGISFSHHDWELACDNTRTCRAAGYHGEEDDAPAVSVLLTRKAGPRQPVTGKLMIGNYGDEESLSKLPPVFKLSMQVNGRNLGQVTMNKDTLVADLSPEQVAALLAVLSQKSKVEWTAGSNRWRLSDKGATAVLLKMDEFQGRIGTTGALVKKGSRSEDLVLPPLSAPVVIVPPIPKPQPKDNQWVTEKSKVLRDALLTTNADDCTLTPEAELSITRLTDTKLLVSTQCWNAAYNSGDGYWVVNQTPPFHPTLVTTSGTHFSDGSIVASHKGRGLGDCWSSQAWTWNGKEFVHTESSTSGMCKLLAPGGAWSLPTLVTDVRHSSH